MMCVGICFGTLSPLISVLTWAYMAFIRLIYGYLFCYAECRKSDLGGVFFHRALLNLFCSLHIYMLIMVGVLCVRSPDIGPVVIACVAWLHVCISHYRFYDYQWERLPFCEILEK